MAIILSKGRKKVEHMIEIQTIRVNERIFHSIKLKCFNYEYLQFLQEGMHLKCHLFKLIRNRWKIIKEKFSHP